MKANVAPVKVPIEMCDTSDVAAEHIMGQVLAHEPHLCYIVNPNMPLGYELPGQSLAHPVSMCPETLFVIDEAYVEYGSGAIAVTLAHGPKVIVTRMFSKAFGLASLHIGYLICSDDDYRMLRVLYNEKDVTALSMQMAHAALEDRALQGMCRAHFDNQGYFRQGRKRFRAPGEGHIRPPRRRRQLCFPALQRSAGHRRPSQEA